MNQRVLKNSIKLSMKGLKCGSNVTRYSMYKHLTEVMNPRNHYGKVLAISHSSNLCQKLIDPEKSQIVEANYPDYNILNLSFPDNEFDYVVSDQVLENIEGDPQIAINETFRVLKPSGLAIHTTCFMNPLHDAPGDFWRFTPYALELLCSQFSKIIDVGSWGNIYVLWMIHWGVRFTPTPGASWHPIYKVATFNDKDWPLATWIIAQK